MREAMVRNEFMSVRDGCRLCITIQLNRLNTAELAIIQIKDIGNSACVPEIGGQGFLHSS